MQSTVSPQAYVICGVTTGAFAYFVTCGRFELIYVDLVLKLRLRRSGSHPTFKAPKLISWR